MQEVVADSAEVLVAREVLTRDDVRSIESHGYETGPAAQSWPQIFFDLYQQMDPLLAGGANLLAWGYFFKDMVFKLRHWKDNKERDFQERLGDGYALAYAADYIPTVVLTGPALVALCYADLVERYGIGNDITVDVLPRSRFGGYASPTHPSGGETYLVRFKSGSMSFFYLVDGFASVSEHYLTTGDDLTLLPLPELLPSEYSVARDRSPERSLHLQIKSRGDLPP